MNWNQLHHWFWHFPYEFCSITIFTRMPHIPGRLPHSCFAARRSNPWQGSNAPLETRSLLSSPGVNWSDFLVSRKGLKLVCICLYVYICVFMPELASLPVRGIRPRRVAPPPSIPPDYYHEDYYHHEEDNVYDNGDDGRREWAFTSSGGSLPPIARELLSPSLRSEKDNNVQT